MDIPQQDTPQQDTPQQDTPQPQLSRPRFLAGLGVGGAVAALAACSTYSEQSTAEPPASEPAPDAGGSAAAPAVLAGTADVPVGSGIIVEDVVLTQPVAGDFKGFSNVCTHTGCRINAVADGTINCPCHGSKFNLDGTVAQGPAARPLDTRSIVVEGDSILAS
jgi:Rieske Fe-S protein